MSDSSLRQLSVCPILQFPSEAEPGKTYLLTIDLRPQQGWPYPNDEEVAVYCLLDTAPLFSHEPLGEPAIVLHRYGGSYGPARFLLTAGTETHNGVIQVTLVNGRGVPLSVFETPVIQVREQVARREEIDLEVSKHRVVAESSPGEARKTARERVLIFYSRNDEKWKDLLIAQLGRLQKQNLLETWDDRQANNDRGFKKLGVALDEASVVAALVSDDFLFTEFAQNPDCVSLIKRQVAEGLRVFPVITNYCDWTRVDWLMENLAYPTGVVPLSAHSESQRQELLNNLAEDIYQHIGQTISLPQEFAPLSPERISISRLPSTGGNLFGRDKEMKILDDAWNDSSTNIISLVASGGVGKSALVSRWLRAMEQDNYRGASRVYAWSFYSQGSPDMLHFLRLHALGEIEGSELASEPYQNLMAQPSSIPGDLIEELHRRYLLKEEPQQNDEWVFDQEAELLLITANQRSIPSRVASSDQFIETALAWFGDTDPHAGSPSNKGERLAQLIGAQRALLVLDGLERVQSFGSDEGRLNDEALRALLSRLAIANEGLCVISTRVTVSDLNSFEGRTAKRARLENLSPEAGAELLKAQGVKGAQAELEQASREFNGHSLTLLLLGKYLKNIYDGDVRSRGEFKALDDAESHTLDIQQSIDSYEKRFGDGPELAVLRMLALFNGPADDEAIAALRAAPAITGLTEPLQSLNETDWQRLLVRLRRIKLLAEPNPNQPGALEIHPLARERFKQQLKQNRPEAWREGNNRLYERLKSTAKEFPNTLEEMLPLFEAVTYGCQAGRCQDAFEMYRRRILRGIELYPHRKLGAFNFDLTTLANFFEQPWRIVKSELADLAKNLIVELAGIDLRAMGRLREAIEAFDASLETQIARRAWGQAAWNAAALSTTLVGVGELARAIQIANDSLGFARQDNYSEMSPDSFSALAIALFQVGRDVEAENAFRQAEELARFRRPEVSFPHLFSGFHYCELLMDQGRRAEAQTRAARLLEFAMQQGWLLEIALGHLLLGQAYESRGTFDQKAYQAARNLFDRAVDELRRAGQLDYLPRGLLARAKLHRIGGEFDQARAHLDETMDIATRSGMALYQADCHLEYAQLYLAQNEREKALESFARAKEMVERVGYHRRDKNIQEVERLFENNLTAETQPSEPVKIFCSYSHKDQRLWNQLANYLALLQRQGFITEWHDRMIGAGDDWKNEINAHLDSSQIILLLVSSDFLASDYCYNIEMKRALERHNRGEARVIPIILRPADWESGPLGNLQALPKNAKAVSLWKNRDQAFMSIVRSIQEIIEEFKPEPTPAAFPLTRIPRPPVVGFVARGDEQGHDFIERLKEELAPQENRLITLSGPGGIGKTTLAAEAARALSDAYGGRVVWSNADGRADFTLSTLLDDTATQLGREDLRPLPLEAKEAAAHALVADPPALVVVDNYETIKPDAQQRIEAWFKRARCSALFTSRQKIDGTVSVVVTAMSREEAEDFLRRTIEQTQDAQIFSAEIRRRIYETAEANPFVMQWVVAQIDAAQEPQTVLEELQQGEGDAATIIFDRSFNLPQLGDNGRAALLALSLFVPSASRDALAEVAGFGRAVHGVNEAVGNLRSLWLIRATDENRRLTVEGLVRSIARARLSKDARADDFRQRFYYYFLSYAEAHAQPTPEDFDALEAEKDNLLGAIDMAFAAGNWESVQAIAKILVTPASMLSVRGYWDEAIKGGEQALAAAREAKNEWSIATFEAYIATFRMNRGEYDEARQTYQRALATFRQLDSAPNIATVLNQLGALAQDQGEIEEARKLYSESLEINKRLGSQRGIAVTLHQLAMLAQAQGEVEEARRLYNESLEIDKRLSNQSGIAVTLPQLGRLAQAQGEVEEARRLYNESLEINKRLGNQSGIAVTLHQLGRLAQAQGEVEEARKLYSESLEINERLGSQSGIAVMLHQLGTLAEQEGNKSEAAQLLREALYIFERLRSPNAEISRQRLQQLEGESG